MSEENQALQRQLLLKREKELESLRVCFLYVLFFAQGTAQRIYFCCTSMNS